MAGLLELVFDTGSFPARWHCGDWTDLHGWTHVVADGLIFGAYFTIPILIGIYIRKRPDLRFPRLGWLFAAFIFACGIGHLIEATLFWQPWYRLSAISKVITASVSWMTAFAVWKNLPRAMRLPGIARLNEDLQREVHERKRIEADLRATEAEFRVIAEALPQIVFVADAAGRNIFVNSYFVDFTGISEADAAGDGWTAAIHVDDREFVERSWREAVETGQDWEVEHRWRRYDGSNQTFIGRATAVRNAAGDVVRWIGYSSNISVQKEAEQRRIDIERRMMETQKLESLGILAGGIAHDFNNLLTGIVCNASLARLELPKASELQPMLEEIELSSMRASDLCTQMLAYAGRGRFVVSNIDVSDVVRETVALLMSSVSKKAAMDFDLEDGLGAVEADITQIRQVVMNLVVNASEALEEQPGEIRISTRTIDADRAYLDTMIGHPELPTGRYVSLLVSDSGSGMSPGDIPRIFDPFYTTRFTGRGLGLSAVLGIARGHGGGISVESTVGEGTTFEFILPVREEPPDARGERAPPSVWRGSGRVLVVDDEYPVRGAVARVLESVGFEVDTASDGAEAIEMVEDGEASYRLVLMDLTMPNVDGREAFARLRALDPTLRVILMSGYSEHDATAGLLDQGLAGFVHKPFRNRDLIDQIRALLAIPSSPPTNAAYDPDP